MKRSTLYLTAALGGLWFGAALLPSFNSISQARSANFEARWTALPVAVKGDRLAAPATAQQSTTVAFDDRSARTTIARKSTPITPNKVKTSPVRDVTPGELRKEKEKLPVGCESSFSPVTSPALANVIGRCLT